MSNPHKPLVWGEFKRLVDSVPGVRDDMPVYYIDASFPTVANLAVTVPVPGDPDAALGLVVTT